MQQVHLHNTAGIEWIALREITGHDELSISGTSTIEAIQLLDSLLVQSGPGSITGSGQESGLAALSAWDREQALASAYVQIYGDKIESVISCSACGANFDLDFSLSELLSSLVPDGEASHIEKIKANVYQMPEGVQFRLPTGLDEFEVIGLSSTQAENVLLQRCVIAHPDGLTADMDEQQKQNIQAAIESVSPIVDVELDASCPECKHQQLVHFDLQHYFLIALNKERSKLMHEVHALASHYGWSLAEILQLPRSQRRVLVQLIESSESVLS